MVRDIDAAGVDSVVRVDQPGHRRWYQHWWLWAAAAVLLPLIDWVAIPLVFRYAPWSTRTKWIVALALAAWAVLGVVARLSDA